MKNFPGGNPGMQSRSKFIYRSIFSTTIIALIILFFQSYNKDDIRPDQEISARSWHSLQFYPNLSHNQPSNRRRPDKLDLT